MQKFYLVPIEQTAELQRGPLTLHRQILAGLEAMDAVPPWYEEGRFGELL